MNRHYLFGNKRANKRQFGLLLFLFALLVISIRCDSDWFDQTSSSNKMTFKRSTTLNRKTNSYKNSNNKNNNNNNNSNNNKNNNNNSNQNQNLKDLDLIYPQSSDKFSDCPNIIDKCVCSSRIGGIICSSLTKTDSSINLEMNTNNFLLSYFVIIGDEVDEHSTRFTYSLDLNMNVFDGSTIRFDRQFWLLLDKINSIELSQPYLLNNNPMPHDSHLYLDNFNFNYVFFGHQLNDNPQNCGNSISKVLSSDTRPAFKTFLSHFSNLYIGFTSKINYPKSVCPFIFLNANLERFHLYNQTNENSLRIMKFYSSKPKVKTSAQNLTTLIGANSSVALPQTKAFHSELNNLNSNISHLIIETSVIDLDSNLLDEYVFKRLKMITIRNSKVNSIDFKIFERKNLALLEYFDVEFRSISYFLAKSKSNNQLFTSSWHNSQLPFNFFKPIEIVLRDFDMDDICELKYLMENLNRIKTAKFNIIVLLDIEEEFHCNCDLDKFFKSFNVEMEHRFNVTLIEKNRNKCVKKQSLSDKGKCEFLSITKIFCRDDDNNNYNPIDDFKNGETSGFPLPPSYYLNPDSDISNNYESESYSKISTLKYNQTLMTNQFYTIFNRYNTTLTSNPKSTGSSITRNHQFSFNKFLLLYVLLKLFFKLN